MSNKEQYRLLCETEGTSIPLFLQYWWMELVCEGKRWDVALAYDRGGHIVGAMPYLIGSKWGLRYVVQPQLTQFNGPWLRPQEGQKESQRLQREKEVFGQLIAQLKELRLVFFRQNFGPSVTNWLPFHWAGYRQTTRYTYRIENLSDLDQVWADFDGHSRRKKIERLSNRYTDDESLTAQEFVTLHQRYWKGRGEADLVPADLMKRVIEGSLERHQGLLLGVRDEAGTLQGARFVVYDDNWAYALLSALNPEGHENGTSALLFWRLMQRLSGTSRGFDFEGSMDEGIEQSYRLYGAKQVPYMQIQKIW